MTPFAQSDDGGRLLRASPDLPMSEQGLPLLTERWQAEMVAMTIRLEAGGVFSLAEWVEVLSQELYASRRHRDAAHYYGCWMEALTRLLTELSITSRDALDQLTERWQAAALATPAGQTVTLPELVTVKPSRRRRR